MFNKNDLISGFCEGWKSGKGSNLVIEGQDLINYNKEEKKMTKQELINQIAGTRILLTKAELEKKADLNEVWEEIATESIQATKEKTFSKEGWKDIELTDDYLYQIEFDEGGIRYYEGTEERYLDVPVAEERWSESQWTVAEIKMLIEGLK